jgi:hypothetical protein
MSSWEFRPNQRKKDLRGLINQTPVNKPAELVTPELTTTEASVLKEEDRVQDRIRSSQPPKPMVEPPAPIAAMDKPPVSKLTEITPEKRATETMVDFASKVPDLTNPTRITQVYDYMDKKFNELDAKDSKWMKEQADKLKQITADVKEEYQGKMDRAARFELADTLGQAMVQLGYAFSTMKNNQLYGGPLQFNKTDWSKAYDRILGERKQAMDEAQDIAKEERAIQKDSSNKRYDSARRKMGIALSLYEDNVREARRRAEQLSKEDGPIDLTKEKEKILNDFRKVDALSNQYRSAKTDRERARLMGQIYTSLKQPEDSVDQKSVEEIEDLEKEKGKFWNWVKRGFTEDKSFEKYVNQIKKARLDALGLSEAPPAQAAPVTPTAPAGTESVPMVTSDGQTHMIPADKVNDALKAGLKRK